MEIASIIIQRFRDCGPISRIWTTLQSVQLNDNARNLNYIINKSVQIICRFSLLNLENKVENFNILQKNFENDLIR